MNITEEGHIHTPLSQCWSCGYKIDCASKLTKKEDIRLPKEGDPSLCLECAALSVFGADGSIHEPTISEMTQFQNEAGLWSEIERLQSGIRHFNATRRKK
jgi:hypothetical protein